MGNSLQDQLVKAGLADAKQARKVRAAKRPKKGQKGTGQGQGLSESAQTARQAMAEKAARDRELNKQRQSKAERKALRAQIRQLIDQNRVPRDEGEVGYYFQDNNKVRKLYVTEALQEQLSNGRLAIVKLDGRYDVVPADLAERIRERDAASVVVCHGSERDDAQDDSYADYPVPDDLKW